VCSPLDTGSYSFADPQRYFVLTASAGVSAVNLSCSLVAQSELAVTDGTIAFIPLEVSTILRSPLPGGVALLLGHWQSDRAELLATLFFADALSRPLIQQRMAGLPIIWAAGAVVTLSAAPLPPPLLSECSSPQKGLWGGVHWVLDLSGTGGSLDGDCSSLNVTGAVVIAGADMQLLVVAGD
jgi:hypothetical protein